MRFLVPQNLDVPDTIFLGLGFKQLVYLGGALGLMVFLFLFVGGIGPALLLGAPVGIFAAFLSFFTYNNQSFVVILQSLIRFVSRKKMYMWRQSEAGVYAERDLRESPSAEQVVDPVSGDHSTEKIKGKSIALVFADEEIDSRSDLDVII